MADDALRGHAVPAGSTLLLSMLITHRMPDLWPDPERFDPGRFLDPDQAPGVKVADGLPVIFERR